MELKAQKEAETKAKNEAYLTENGKKEGVVTLPDGLQYRIIRKGDGAVPKETDRVQVAYEGKTIDGKVFDATARHGVESDTFAVNGLIKGWTEALQMMPVGSKWEIVIPQQLAYGARGAGKDIAGSGEETPGKDRQKKCEKVRPWTVKHPVRLPIETKCAPAAHFLCHFVVCSIFIPYFCLHAKQASNYITN